MNTTSVYNVRDEPTEIKKPIAEAFRKLNSSIWSNATLEEDEEQFEVLTKTILNSRYVKL